MKFYEAKLANGLTIIGEERESAVSVATGFFVKTGSRDESSELSGVSHFLEHMMFKGTARRSALDITYELSAIGAQANAFTSGENTVFYAAVLPEYLEKVFDILADMLRPSLDEQEFSTEKKVILEEIALYKDRPSHVLYEAAIREFFKEHSAGNSVLGSTDSVSALTAQQMRDYFERRYTAPNIVLAIAGKFNWQQVLDLAEKYCGRWSSAAENRAIVPHAPEKSKLALSKDELQCAHLCLVAAGPDATDDYRYPIQVLTCILGDSDGSRAYWELIDKGLADSAYIDSEEMDGTGLVLAYASTDPDHADKVCSILSGIMTTPDKYTQADLDRAITKLRTRLVLQGESSMRRLMAIGTDWIYRCEYMSLAEEAGRLKAVTKKEIDAALERFDFSPMTTVLMLPTEKTS